MTKQGVPAEHRPDDDWWDTVYAGPSGTLPDTPYAGAGEGSVDDWFDTAAGLIGPQRTGEREPVPEAVPEPAAESDGVGAEALLGRDSIDDWFDTAVGVIGAQRTGEPEPVPVEPVPVPVPAADVTHKFEAPDLAADRALPEPAEEPAEPDAQAEPDPAPEPDPEPEPEPEREPEPAPEPELPPRAALPTQPTVPASSPSPSPSPRAAAIADTQPAPVPHVGERPPTYGPEPTAVPEADPTALEAPVPDTVLEGAQYGPATLRAVSVRGDSARFRGEPRRDALLVTRFGEGADGLLLAALASYARAAEAPEPAAVAAATAEACRQLAAAIGRSRAELAADLRAGARDRLRYGLQRLATSATAPLRALEPAPAGAATGATAGEEAPDQAPAASLHCLLLSLDPRAGHRAAFGTGPGGLYLLRSGHWIDAYAARLLHHPDGQQPVPGTPVPEPRPFRFRLVPATPGDILLLCTPGLAGPVADEPAVAHFLATHWAHPHPPGTVDFLRQVQVRAKGYADDRTAAALWTE